MKKRNIFSSELKESVVKAFDLPPDLAYGSVLVSVTGQSGLLIENYRGIPHPGEGLPDTCGWETAENRILHQ